MKIYYPSALVYICYFKNLYCFNNFDVSIQQHQKWLDKIDEMFFNKVFIKLYYVSYNQVRIKRFPPFGVESQMFENLLEDCYEIANSVNDEEMKQEKLKYFHLDLYKL